MLMFVFLRLFKCSRKVKKILSYNMILYVTEIAKGDLGNEHNQTKYTLLSVVARIYFVLEL